MAIRQYRAGETIYSKGEPSRAAFVVLSGAVQVGNRMAETGAVLGAETLFKQLPYRETATAKIPCSLQVVTAQAFNDLLEESPAEVQKILTGLLQKPVVEDQAEVGKPTASLSTIQNKTFEELEEVKPIRQLLQDETINDILVNGPKDIFIEREGKLEKIANVAFTDDQAVYKLAEKIVSLVGRKLDPQRPLVDARLQDGSRVNIIAPPLAVDGTSISIRKFPSRRLTLDSMRDQHNMSAGVCEFLKIVSRCRINTAVSGGTGSGKTTLLNAMIDYIDHSERIVTIEDAVELRPKQPDVVRLETRPSTAGVKVAEQVTMRDLVRNALRMRPDRIIVGEVRGEEAFDMLQAMNTGHEGSLTTIHANHPRDAMSRLENMINMANVNLPIKALRYQIASALHLVIQISRMRDGHRRITHISEVVGMEGEMVTMHDLFTFNVEKEDKDGRLTGSFKWSGIMPRFLRRIAYYGEMKHLEEALGVSLPKTI